MLPLERRVAAAQSTLDRFKQRPFSFTEGRDCFKLAAHCLRELGVMPPVLHKLGRYTNEFGAARALRKIGFETVGEFMDAHFPRIPAAAALVADVVEIPGEGSLGSLTIAVGNGRVLGYHQEAEGAVVMQPLQFVTGWRVI